MLVSDCMSKKVALGNPTMSLQEAAIKMREGDFGSLPIAENDRLVGMITDRDIAVRAVAEGRDPQKAEAKDYMSNSVFYCFEDESIEDVLNKFGQQQIRRLPVLSREKRLVGILSLGDLARKETPAEKLEETLSQVCSKSNQSQASQYANELS